MIRSMTSYGRANEILAGKDVLIEIKSVNNRFFDCTIKIAKMYGFMEEKVKSFLQSRGIARGKIDVYVNIERLDTIGMEVHLDDTYVQNYLNALYRLRDTYGLKDDLSVMTIAQNREIFTVVPPEENMEQDWMDVLPVLEKAVTQFIQMREQEGENLQRDIQLKKQKIQEIAATIDRLSVTQIDTYRTRLEQRIRQILADSSIALDDNRILTECAIFADKVAIDEEIVRLHSHFDAFDAIFDQAEPVGRKLDFLLQEINREVNTIGSKANDVEIAQAVVDMKSELEKIREQIQNIE